MLSSAGDDEADSRRLARRERSHFGDDREREGVEKAVENRSAFQNTHIPMAACEAVFTFRGPALPQKNGDDGGMLHLWYA
jgi:hypothetical protein